MSNFHPCTSCMRKLPLQDKHTLYVKCLSTELASDALADRSSCPICARSKEKTLESRMVHYSGEPRRAVIGLGIPGLPSPPFKPYAKYSLCTGSTALQQSLKICLEGQKESEKHGPGKGHRRVKGLNGPDTRALKQAAGTPAPAPAPPAPAPQHTPASPVITAEVQQQDLVMIEEEQDALSIAASRDEESFLQAGPRPYPGQKPGRWHADSCGCRQVRITRCAYLPWPYLWTIGRGELATLSQRAKGVPAGGCDAPLPCLGTGKGETMASCSYHGNPEYPGPYSTMGRPEAPPPGLRGKELATRKGERRMWGPSAPVPRETVQAEPPQAASKTASAPASAPASAAPSRSPESLQPQTH
ncbi:UNVERIFIED_CONTAM: hypothetical protein FKN15_057207 [Acipenser sinensis]